MIAKLPQHLRFSCALKSRSYTMIWIGQTISGLGDGIFSIALAWQILLMTHSGTTMSIVMIASMIPRLLFLLIGGVTADRLPRKKIILWSNIGRGLVVLFVGLLGFTGLLQLWHLVIESLIFGLVDGFFSPAIMAITPDLVQKKDLPSANALNSASANLTQFIGPLLGAGLLALLNPMSIFVLNGLSFFISVLFLAPVQISERHVLITNRGHGVKENIQERRAAQACNEQKRERTKKERHNLQEAIVDIQKGLFYVRNSPWLWVSIICLSLGNMGMAGPLIIAMPKLIHDVYGQGTWLLGAISSAGPAGSLLGLVLVGQTKRLKRRGLLSYLALIPSGISLVLLGLPWSHSAFFFVGPVANAMFGCSIAFFNTTWYTILQELIPVDKLGRVISLDMLGSFALIPISEVLAGTLTDSLGPAMVFLLGGLFALITNFLPLLVHDVRKIE